VIVHVVSLVQMHASELDHLSATACSAPRGVALSHRYTLREVADAVCGRSPTRRAPYAACAACVRQQSHNYCRVPSEEEEASMSI